MNQVVILAGGHGKRMKAEIPKPMLKVMDLPMLNWVIRACEAASLSRICVITGYKSQYIEHYLNDKYTTALQPQRLGTGHAVMQAVPFLQQELDGNTLVLCGDAPFMDAETIQHALTMHEQQGNAVTVITAELDQPHGYGRILRTETGIAGIVEEKDATEEQRRIQEVNSGAYWFRTADLIALLDTLEPSNAQGEYYLTDTVGAAIAAGKRAGAYKTKNADVVLGANTRKDLLMLNEVARQKILDKHMENGVNFVCTDGILIGRDVEIGAETTILPGTIIKGKTKIGMKSTIGPNCLIENCSIGDLVTLNYVQAYESLIEDAVKIGPFVHIRPNSHIKNGVKIGDFVEVKNSTIGEQTAIAHLTYVGDADVGSGVNLGCGVVFVNYDGTHKYRAQVGDDVFVGCNSNLVSPVQIGDGAYIAAGSTVTEDVEADALYIARSRGTQKQGWVSAKGIWNKKSKAQTER